MSKKTQTNEGQAQGQNVRDLDQRTTTFMARLVEDAHFNSWEFITRRPTDAHREAWKLLTRKPDLESVEIPGNLGTDVKPLIERFFRVANQHGFKVKQLAPDKFRLIHKLPLLPVEPEKINIDLRWSLWSEDEETFEERSPGIVEKMRDAFLGLTAPLTVHTAPNKECRCGQVTISRGKAEGTFACEWDEASDLAQTLGIEYDDAFVESLPGSGFLCGIGVERSFIFKTRTFERLIALIDKEEDALLRADRREWEGIERMWRFDASEKYTVVGGEFVKFDS